MLTVNDEFYLYISLLYTLQLVLNFRSTGQDLRSRNTSRLENTVSHFGTPTNVSASGGTATRPTVSFT